MLVISSDSYAWKHPETFGFEGGYHSSEVHLHPEEGGKRVKEGMRAHFVACCRRLVVAIKAQSVASKRCGSASACAWPFKDKRARSQLRPLAMARKSVIWEHPYADARGAGFLTASEMSRQRDDGGLLHDSGGQLMTY